MNQTGLSQNLLSHHLSVLTEAGLIRSPGIGDARRRYFSLNFEAPQLLATWWRQQGLGGTPPYPAEGARERAVPVPPERHAVARGGGVGPRAGA